MTTPNFDTAGTGGYKSDADLMGGGMNSGSQANSGSGQMDDVSLGQSMGGRGGMDSAKDSVKRGISSAEGAVGQLQQKASDVTSKFINNIDVDDLTQKLEQQVREHPARTLAMAIGAGFLLGRAAKR